MALPRRQVFPMTPPRFGRASRPAFRIQHARKRSGLGPKSPPTPGTVYIAAVAFMLSCSAPVVEATKSVEVSVPAAGLSLTVSAPLVGSGAYLEVPAASFALEAAAPSVSAAQSIQAPSVGFLLSTAPPVVVGVKVGVVAAPGAAFVLGSGVPSVSVTVPGAAAVLAPPLSLALVPSAPAVTFTAASPAVSVPGVSFELTPAVPSAAVVSVVAKTAPAASFGLTAVAPVARTTVALSPPAVSFALTTSAPAAFSAVSRQVPAVSLALVTSAPDAFVLPAPVAGYYLGWDANGKIVNLSPQAILDSIASSTPAAGWWIDTGA